MRVLSPLLLGTSAAASAAAQQPLLSASSYDYVVVGGGASGLPAAMQLAKKYPAATVAVLERGESDADDPRLQTASGWPATINTRHAEFIRYKDTRAWTVVGNVLGGGTTINAGIESVADDAYLTQEWGFGTAELAQYRALADEVVFNGRVAIPSPDDTLPATTSYNAAVALGATPAGHSKTPVQGVFKTYTNFNFTADTRRTLGAELRDFQAQGQLQNLHVATKSLVTKIILDNAVGVKRTDNATSSTQPRATGVELADGSTVSATQAVVLAAGAVHTPRLLMASGVGPASQLKSKGIAVVVENDAVGGNFLDRNLASTLQLNLNKIAHDEFSIPNIAVNFTSSTIVEFTGGGDVASAFARATVASMPACLRGDLSRALVNGMMDSPWIGSCTDRSFQINLLQMDSTTVGQVKASKHVADKPEVYAGHQTAHDAEWSRQARAHIEACVASASMRARMWYLDTDELQAVRRPDHCVENCLAPNLIKNCAVTPKPWKYNSRTFPHAQAPVEPVSSLHLFGGAAYGGVTDTDFRVKGVDALAVVDASLYAPGKAPDINPQGQIVVMAAYIAKHYL